MPVYKYKVKAKTKYYVTYQFNKKQVLKRGFDKKEQAYAYLAKVLNNPAFKNNFKVVDTAEQFKEYLYTRLKEASAYRYNTLFKSYILKYFGNLSVNAITNHDLEIFNKKVNSLKLKSKNNVIYISKVFIRFLRSYGLDSSINENLLYIYKEKYVEVKNYDYYTIDEFKQFLSVIISKRDRLVFQLLFYYGLRIGELRGLKHSDIYNNQLFIKRCISNKTGQKGQNVVSVKTSSSLRSYPLLENIKKAYEEFASSPEAYKNNNFIFAVKISKRKAFVVGESTLKRAQTEYCELAKLRVIKFHEFRHSCATYLFNKNCPVELISSWLGHSDMSTTLRVYAHLMPSRKLKTASYFDEN